MYSGTIKGMREIDALASERLVPSYQWPTNGSTATVHQLNTSSSPHLEHETYKGLQRFHNQVLGPAKVPQPGVDLINVAALREPWPAGQSANLNSEAGFCRSVDAKYSCRRAADVQSTGCLDQKWMMQVVISTPIAMDMTL
jgi:hypothetical protein